MGLTLQEQVKKYCDYLQEWNAMYEEYAKSVGLSYTSLQILELIYDSEECTQKMLCEKTFLPKQTVNTIITAFYKKGIVRLAELPEDRRTKTVSFTPGGKEYAEKIVVKMKYSDQKAMELLSEAQREALLESTRCYVENCRKYL